METVRDYIGRLIHDLNDAAERMPELRNVTVQRRGDTWTVYRGYTPVEQAARRLTAHRVPYVDRSISLMGGDCAFCGALGRQFDVDIQHAVSCPWRALKEALGDD